MRKKVSAAQMMTCFVPNELESFEGWEKIMEQKPVKVKGIGGQHFKNYNNQLMEQLLGRCFKY